MMLIFSSDLIFQEYFRILSNIRDLRQPYKDLSLIKSVYHQLVAHQPGVYLRFLQHEVARSVSAPP